jgi:DNA-directed RNA polymerase subunit L
MLNPECGMGYSIYYIPHPNPDKPEPKLTAKTKKKAD